MSKTKPYADLKAKVGTFTDKDGNEKGKYVRVGTLFASDNFNNMFIVMESLPLGDWNGMIGVYKREENYEI